MPGQVETPAERVVRLAPVAAAMQVRVRGRGRSEATCDVAPDGSKVTIAVAPLVRGKVTPLRIEVNAADPDCEAYLSDGRAEAQLQLMLDRRGPGGSWLR